MKFNYGRIFLYGPVLPVFDPLRHCWAERQWLDHPAYQRELQ